MKRQHPIALIGYTSKYFWLLLIPLIRGLYALKFDFINWIEGAGWDILTVAVIIALAVIRWYCTRYEITERVIRVSSGFFFRQEKSLPISMVSAATADDNPVYRKIGASRVYIDTDAASGKKTSADISLAVYAGDRDKLFDILSSFFESSSGDVRKERRPGYTYKVSPLSLIAFSLLFSSALSGVVLLVTAVTGSAKIVGEHLERDLLKAVNDISDAAAEHIGRIISGISPAGIAISIVIAAGFGVSFISNILRYVNFTVTRRGGCIFISGGLITRRTHCINSRKINIADMRQNLLMKIFGVTSVHVNCTGYGKRKNEFPVFVPICSIKSTGSGEVKGLTGIMEMLLTGFTGCSSFINTRLPHIMRFILPPALLIIAIPGVSLLLLMIYPGWSELIRFMTAVAEIPAVWLLLAKACDYCTGGINMTADSICAKYCKGYDFHTITVPLERIAQIRIKQSLLQRLNRSCDVIILTSSEYIGGHRIKSMPINEVQEMLRERHRG